MDTLENDDFIAYLYYNIKENSILVLQKHSDTLKIKNSNNYKFIITIIESTAEKLMAQILLFTEVFERGRRVEKFNILKSYCKN